MRPEQLRMCFMKCNLLRKFVRMPAVIGIEKGDPLMFCQGNTPISGSRNAAVGLGDNLCHVMKRCQFLQCIVRRTVIDNDDLICLARL